MKLRSGLLLASLLVVMGAVGTVRAQHAQHYVLDSFGGVHAGGGAPAITPRTPYFGFDVAADIEYIPVGTNAASGDGILVLDKFGGVHKGGALSTDPPVGPTPYFGFDAARAIAYRSVPSRVAHLEAYTTVDVTNSNFLVMNSIATNAPDDGHLLVIATVQLQCAVTTAATGLVLDLVLNVDSTTAIGVPLWRNRIEPGDCLGHEKTITMTTVFPVGAGPHSVFLLAQNAAPGGNTPRLRARTLNAIYIDQNGLGSS